MFRFSILFSLLTAFSLMLKAEDWHKSVDSLQTVLVQEHTDTGKISIYLKLSEILLRNQPDKALEYVIDAKKIAEELSDSNKMVLCYLQECDFYSQIGEYSTSLEIAYDALNLASNDNLLLCLCHNRIATVHAGLNNFNETVYHNKKSLQYSSATGDSSLIIVDIHNIGRGYTDLKMYDSALFYLRKANRYEIVHKGRPDPYSLSNIGNVYIELGKYDSALYYHLLAYKYDTEDDQKYLLGIDQQFIANTYFKMKRYDEAEAFALRSNKTAYDVDAYDLTLDNYEILYKIYSEKGDFKKALDYALLFNATKDTLREKSKQSLIYGLETKYRVHEQEAKLSITEKQKTLYLILAIVSILFLISMIVIVILVYRRKRVYQELSAQLRLTNESKEKVLSIISHDLRSSIGTLRIAAKAISEGMTNVDDTRVLLESFYPVADSTYDLLENLLTWAKYNQEKIAPSFIEINLKEITEKSIEHVHHLAISKSIMLINNVPDQNVHIDKNMILSVIRNLLSNAIKFSYSKSRVIIDFTKNKDFYIMSVSDSGIGMDDETIRKIFSSPEEVQSSGTMGERGSGLGIMICKTFLKSHGGDIWVESELGKGSTFYFSLPVKH
jgi:two-component system, sensor histidine kinase and response regulator